MNLVKWHYSNMQVCFVFQLAAMIQAIKDLANSFFHGKLIHLVDRDLVSILIILIYIYNLVLRLICYIFVPFFSL